MITDDLRREIQRATDAGMSLRELGRRAGVGHSDIASFLRGERGLGWGSAEKVAAVLGLRLTRPRNK